MKAKGTAVSCPRWVLIKKAFPILALSVFAGMLGLGIISPLMPVYARDLGATGIWIGVLLASYSVSRAVFMPFIARFSDKRGRRIILATGLLFYAVMYFFYMGVEELWQLMLVRILHGSAGGMIIPIAKAYVGELSPEGEEGTWMGYYNTAFFAGMGAGPLVGGTLYDAFAGAPLIFGKFDPGLVAAFGAMGLLNLIGAVTVFFFLPEIPLGLSRRKPRPSFRKMLSSNPFRGLLSLRLVEGLGRTSYSAFLPIYAGLQLGLSTTQTGTLVTIHVLLSALLQAPMGKITDKFSQSISRRSLILSGGVLIVIYMLLVPLTTQFWQLIMISIIAGMVSSMTTPAGSAIAVGEGRKFGMASVMAAVSLTISAGQALGPLLGGIVAELANRGLAEGVVQDVRAVFYFAAIFVAIGIGLFGWFTRPAADVPLPALPPVVTPPVTS